MMSMPLMKLASDVVTHELICVVDVNVLLELHSVCGDEIDDLDVTEGHVEDLLMLVDLADYLSFDVTALWWLYFVVTDLRSTFTVVTSFSLISLCRCDSLLSMSPWCDFCSCCYPCLLLSLLMFGFVEYCLLMLSKLRCFLWTLGCWVWCWLLLLSLTLIHLFLGIRFLSSDVVVLLAFAVAFVVVLIAAVVNVFLPDEVLVDYVLLDVQLEV